MATPIADRIQELIPQANQLYHRLILVVGPSGSGKTVALQHVAQSQGAAPINVNLELSRRMLELTEQQRALQAATILGKIVDEAADDLALLDNLEILFDVHLQLDPLRLLQGLSRKRTIVATWNGSIVQGQLVYAAPDHPEYRSIPADGILIVNAGN